jgi:transglutaminase-like putative cysteine protease
MRFSVSGALSYNVKSAATFIINLHVLRTRTQVVLQESFYIDPYYKIEEFNSSDENRYVRLEVSEPAYININYNAIVETRLKLIPGNELTNVSVMQMAPSVLPYFYPSRYCQSDRLFRFADSRFGKIDNAFEKVLALTNWIHQNIEYLNGSTTSQTSAFDTITEQAGVCRDFAHLGIALCRALDIPARYFTGYAYLLQPEDFHACFEAFIGGYWVIFDATKLAPLNGLVKIAAGRDAADAAIATIFGDVEGTFISASCLLVDADFEPLYYDSNNTMGIAYL